MTRKGEKRMNGSPEYVLYYLNYPFNTTVEGVSDER
jgi:hypothetical protein